MIFSTTRICSNKRPGNSSVHYVASKCPSNSLIPNVTNKCPRYSRVPNYQTKELQVYYKTHLSKHMTSRPEKSLMDTKLSAFTDPANLENSSRTLASLLLRSQKPEISSLMPDR